METTAPKDGERYNQLLLKSWTYKVLDRGPGAKRIWGRGISKILPLINGQLLRLHRFTTTKIVPGFAPKRKAMDGHTQEIRPDITHVCMREAIQGEIGELEETPEGLLIEKIIDENGKSSKLLWFNPYRKIIPDMKGTHKPPDRIPRAERYHPSLLVL